MVVRYLCPVGAMLVLWMAAAGCADTNKATTQPMTAAQKNAMDDPMSYGPNQDPSYVADHGLGPSDKPSLAKQIHDFWNP
jgi:hypothetical protein